jgi:hypothetical protein
LCWAQYFTTIGRENLDLYFLAALLQDLHAILSRSNITKVIICYGILLVCDMTSSSIFWRMKQMPGARTCLGFQNIIFHASQAKKIIDHRWRVAFWMTCHTQVRLYVCSISSLFIIIILLAEVVFPIECFKMRNTCCLCMTYCNSLL